MTTGRRPSVIGAMLLIVFALLIGFNFTFAAVQGDFGLFRRVEANAEKARLIAERDRLVAEAGRMTNLTLRLSDSYIDLDLLDERAREVLGLVRADEIVIH